MYLLRVEIIYIANIRIQKGGADLRPVLSILFERYIYSLSVVYFFGNSMKYKGELFIVSSLALWGFFPLIAKTILVDINPILSLAFISFFAIFWFLIFFVKNKEWKYFQASI